MQVSFHPLIILSFKFGISLVKWRMAFVVPFSVACCPTLAFCSSVAIIYAAQCFFCSSMATTYAVQCFFPRLRLTQHSLPCLLLQLKKKGMASLKGPELSGKPSFVFTQLKYFSSDIFVSEQFQHVAESCAPLKNSKKMFPNAPGFAKFANIFFHE